MSFSARLKEVVRSQKQAKIDAKKAAKLAAAEEARIEQVERVQEAEF
jgi:hypothetical protein